MELRGSFSTYELTSQEKDTFADYLQHSMNNPAVEFIKYLLGDDYIRFMDIMSGTTLKIPSQKTLTRDLESVKIYLYAKRNNFSETSVREAAKLYGKSALTARRYIYKVARVLGSEDELEGDALNNYISYIKSVSEIDSYYQTKADARRDEINKMKEQAMLSKDSNNLDDFNDGDYENSEDTENMDSDILNNFENDDITEEISEDIVISCEEDKEIRETLENIDLDEEVL